MAGYRFCRTDDAPLLVDAMNACWAPHFPEKPKLTVEDYREAVRVGQLWASSCMIAKEGDDLVGVLLAARREDENAVLRVAVRPDVRRRGHAGHLLASLRSKLAILGPPRIRVEVPEAWDASRSLFEGLGFRVEAAYADYRREPGGSPGAEAPPVTAVPVAEIAEGDLPDGLRPPTRAWTRTWSAMSRRSDHPEAWILDDGEQIQAWLVASRDAERRRAKVLSFGAASADVGRPGFLTLVEALAASVNGPVDAVRLHEEEVPASWWGEAGFAPMRRTLGLACVASGDDQP